MSMEPIRTDLSALVQALSATHQQLQNQAARSVDTALVLRNWLFGWHIVEFENGVAARTEAYGKQLLLRLSDELGSRGLKGVSITNLKQCRTFYLMYPEMGQTPSDPSSTAPNMQKLAERLSLGWSHYVVLLSVTDGRARSFYEIEAQQGSWGVRELKRQIGSALFERLSVESKFTVESYHQGVFMIAEQEQKERHIVVQSALASQRMEGLEPDAKVLQDAQKWACGEMTLSAAIDQFKARLQHTLA